MLVMEWSAKVEVLLQKNLSLGEELKNFKTTIEEKLSQESQQLDQKLDASANRNSSANRKVSLSKVWVSVRISRHWKMHTRQSSVK